MAHTLAFVHDEMISIVFIFQQIYPLTKIISVPETKGIFYFVDIYMESVTYL